MPNKKEDFIIPEIFEVEQVNYKAKTLRDSNAVDGPGYSSWITGVIPYAHLKVKNKKIPELKEIILAGVSNLYLNKGDKIRAHFHKYSEIKAIEDNPHDYKITYIERDFQETEKVSKIEKLIQKSNNKFDVFETYEGMDINDF